MLKNAILDGVLRRPLRHLAWLVAGLALVASSAPASAQADSKTKVVKLVIDYGDGSQKHFNQIAWRDGITVLDALNAAKKHPRGIKFRYRGSGATAFLTSLDDLENEGRGRNWIFRVNGNLADRSFGIYKLRQGDTVLWKFGAYK